MFLPSKAFLLHIYIMRYTVEIGKEKRRNKWKKKKESDGDRHFISYKKCKTTRVIPIFPMGFDRLTAKSRNLRKLNRRGKKMIV